VIRRAAVGTARLAAAMVFLVTWGYGVTTYSPFAFDMFVSPRLFPWLADFAVWHHMWYWAAFLLSAATLFPDLIGSRRGPARMRVVWWAGAGYLVVFGLVGVYLVATPHLASLGSGSRSVFAVPGALLPMLWLAVIDHLAAPIPSPGQRAAHVTGQRRLLMTCLGAGGFLWLAHLFRAMLLSDRTEGVLPSVLAAAWALALDLGVFLIVYVVLSLASAIAATRKSAFVWEYGLAVALVAIAIGEFFRHLVLPTLSFSSRDATAISAPLGAVLALTWSGRRLRSAADRPDHVETAVGLLGSPRVRSHSLAALLLCAVPLAAAVALELVAQIDWAFVLQNAITVIEAILVFGLVWNLSPRTEEGAWSMRALLTAPLVALMALHATPFAAATLMATTGDARFAPQLLIDRYRTTDVLAGLATRGLIEQPGSDAGYYRALLDAETRQSAREPTVPETSFASSIVPSRAPQPHVFVFVIDSLRRDYLSPYNPAVGFTPAIDDWARESFVFRNAFTPYGGTWLAMPSIWTGSAVIRSWARIFERMNAIEPLIVAADYDFVINDFTVAQALRPSTRRTFLDPSIPSVQTDLCQNVESLQSHLGAQSATARPVFAFLAPMNVHILNTGAGSTVQDPRYPGFYAPYASRLERLDRCFGSFVSYLKTNGLYENSVILLTSDHGDSLGSEGRWGHQFFLFPEDIHIPLIVRLPSGRESTLTADLDRITFLTDIAPTLLALLGQPVRNLGPAFGSPLFVDPDQEPTSRRRESFLVMSSYGSSYGILRRNGRFLYISDLLDWREYAYTLFREPLGERVAISDALRRVNQRLIRERVDRVNALYRLE